MGVVPPPPNHIIEYLEEKGIDGAELFNPFGDLIDELYDLKWRDIGVAVKIPSIETRMWQYVVYPWFEDYLRNYAIRRYKTSKHGFSRTLSVIVAGCNKK